MENITNSQKLNAFLAKEKSKVISYLRRTFSSYREEDIDDIFQDSSISLYNNILEGKYTSQENASLLTYFISICRNNANSFRRVEENNPEKVVSFSSIGDSGKEEWKDDAIDNERVNSLLEMTSDDEDPMALDNMEKRIREIVAGLNRKCEQLIWGVYRDNLTMDTLAKMLGFSSSDSAKTQKNKCMNSFREKFNLYKD